MTELVEAGFCDRHLHEYLCSYIQQEIKKHSTGLPSRSREALEVALVSCNMVWSQITK